MARHRMTITAAASGIMVLLLAGVAWAATTTRSAQTKKLVVKVGVLYPLTGPNAQQASETLHGVQLAADVMNGKYPKIKIPPLKNVQIQLEVADSQSNPQVCSADVDRFMNDGVAGIVGGFGSSETLACSQEAERDGMPYTNGSASSPTLVNRGLKYFFHVGPTDDILVVTYLNWLKSIRSAHPVKRVAVLARNDQFGNDAISLVKRYFPPAGIDVVASVTYDPNAADLSSQVQNVENAHPDAVVVVPNTPDAIVLMRTMKNLNYTPPAILGFGGGFNDANFFTAVGPLAKDIITRATWSPVLAAKSPLAQSVANLYQSKYGIAMSENSARDFTAMRVMAMAIDQVKSTDRNKIRAALSKFTLAGKKTIESWRGIKFSAKGQNIWANGVIQQWNGENWVILYPNATGKLAWPMPSLG